MLRPARYAFLLFSAIALLAAGPALAKKVDLDGATASLKGKYTLEFKDGDGKFRCGPVRRNTGVNLIFDGRRVNGNLAGRFFEGKVKQSGKGGRKLKVKLTKIAKDALADGIGDLVDGCILNVGSKVKKLKQIVIKATINKKSNKLKVGVEVEFEAKGDGLLKKITGDDARYDLKVSGPLILAPPPPPPAIRNLAVAAGALVAQSSDFASNRVAEFAIDGETNGNFDSVGGTATQAEESPWFAIDLGGSFEIQRVVLWNRSDCCRSRIDGAEVTLLTEDGSMLVPQFTSAPVQSSAFRVSGNGLFLEIDARNTVAAYLQIRLPKKEGVNQILSLAEVQVFGR